MLTYAGELILYYSDQRDPNNTLGQKMVHQTTTDLHNWGPIVDDIVYPDPAPESTEGHLHSM